MAVTAGFSDTAIENGDNPRGKIGQAKVNRYWPGKAPEWAVDKDEDGDIRMARVAGLEKAFPSLEETDVMRKDDPRLRRLAKIRIDNREEVREDRRCIRQAEIVSTIEEERRRVAVTAGFSDTAIENGDNPRGKIGQAKVNRYWPGKAPEWAVDKDEDGDIRMARVAGLEKAFPSLEETDVMRKDDPRLRRLAKIRIDNREEVREDRRCIRQAEIVSTIEEERRREEGLDLEDEDALEQRRRRIREKLLQSQQEEAALMPEEEEEVEEEESEYETDSEEETTAIVMVKLVFVPKSERDTIAELERLEAEERALEEAEKRRMKKRRVETKQLVVEKIREDQEIQRNIESEAIIADFDTDDEVNEAEEYEAWKAREIARIKGVRDDKEAMLREKEEIERVRNMTEEERREWERKNPKPTGQSKRKRRFMQKYYHKGPFFQTNPDDHAGTAKTHNIYSRDFSAPTGEDKMQVRHFGRSRRVKWTNLDHEDTTDGNYPLVLLT